MTLHLALEREAADPVRFAETMRRHAAGVTVVTSTHGRRPWGTTVTAFVSVSIDPPTVLVSLASTGTGAQAIEQTRRFGVSILARRQRAVARHCARPGAPKHLERFTAPGEWESSTPMIAGSLAHFDCELVDRLEVGDHTLFVGRVRRVRARSGGEPLVYADRSYHTLAVHAFRDPRGERP
jgi:flavin reductase (DIM6/NTAB) family NADH-FMN oxidoreductase RutF